MKRVVAVPAPDRTGGVELATRRGPGREPEGDIMTESKRIWILVAPAQGLIGIYGDPARGFAGGYEVES